MEIDANSNHNDKKTLQDVRCQATAYVIEDKENVQEGARNAPTFELSIKQHATDPFRQQAAAEVWKAEAKYTVDHEGRVVWNDRIDGTIQILLAKMLRNRLLYNS